MPGTKEEADLLAARVEQVAAAIESALNRQVDAETVRARLSEAETALDDATVALLPSWYAETGGPFLALKVRLRHAIREAKTRLGLPYDH